ncbi:hypothetical protein F7Q99_12170 [Streptomyces kaniharaensis]|uniref:Uncharacterized protein n=1 Tax=Streptomyces kaniharaensis TaxID=212423 RepID=A0A6N7KTU1_9ACTN|nr:hypothetical protein [Streptomyces kaniharaensis]MQS13023.1 hypothetical protein [Streptomyces kaniharaensis]
MPRVRTAPVKPDVAKAVAAWDDGSSTEALPVAVADSPMRWIAIPQKAGVGAKSVKLYAVDGTVLLTDTQWFHRPARIVGAVVQSEARQQP